MTVLLSSLYLQLVFLMIILGASSPVRSRARCPKDKYYYDETLDVHYNVSSEKLSWNKALERCVGEGATLGAINTMYKVVIVSDLKHKADRYVWTGIAKYSDEDTPWINVANNSIEKDLPWLSGRPRGEGRCVAVGRGSGLIDEDCTREFYYVCETAHPNCN